VAVESTTGGSEKEAKLASRSWLRHSSTSNGVKELSNKRKKKKKYTLRSRKQLLSRARGYSIDFVLSEEIDSSLLVTFSPSFSC